jgi:hypothetical protein
MIVRPSSSTSNHIHLLVYDAEGGETIPKSIQLSAGHTAQQSTSYAVELNGGRIFLDNADRDGGLNLTQSAVSRAVRRGKEIVKELGLSLVDEGNA